MGWGDTAYNWFSQSVGFVAGTTLKVWDGIKTMPKIVWHFATNPAAQQVSRSMAHILFEDIIPYLLLNQAFQALEQYLEDSYAENPPILPAYFALEVFKNLCQSAMFIYWLRQKQRSVVRFSVVSIENNRAWKKLRKTEPFTICKDEDCSVKRFIGGEIRDSVVFLSTELVLLLLKYVPYGGSTTSTILTLASIYHKGRFALSSVLSADVCQRHRQIYIDNNRNLALSLGLLHYGSAQLTGHAVRWMINIPAKDVAEAVSNLYMLITIAATAMLDLPKYDKNYPERWPDPVALFQMGMGEFYDIIMCGLRERIPKWKCLQGPKQKIDWHKIYEQYQLVQKQPAPEFARLVLISNTVHSLARLKQDPVIKHFCEKLCTTIADIAEEAVKWGKSWTVRTLTFNEMMKKFSIRFAYWYKNYPEKVSKQLIEAITNKKIQKLLLQIAKTMREKPAASDVLSTNFFIRQVQGLGKLMQTCLQMEHHDANKAALIMVNGLLWAATPIRDSLKSKPPIKPPPRLVNTNSGDRSRTFTVNDHRREKFLSEEQYNHQSRNRFFTSETNNTQTRTFIRKTRTSNVNGKEKPLKICSQLN